MGAGAQQAGLAQQTGSGAQHFGAQHVSHLQQHVWQAKMSFSPQNRSRTGVIGWQQVLQQPQAGFSQQVGSGAQHFTGAVGRARVAAATATSPAQRSSNSKLNAWLQRATLSRSAPNTGMLFIEQPLLYNELRSRCPDAGNNNQSVTQVGTLLNLGGSSHG